MHRGKLLRIAALLTIAFSSTGAIAGELEINGAFSNRVTKPTFTSNCPAGTGNECGSIDLVGIGIADWAYVFGPTFVPTGQKGCFIVDGTFSLTLRSDNSFISGPLVGVFCSRLADIAHQHVGAISYGNPFYEDDAIQLINGTGRFVGFHGTAVFHTFSAGAVFQGTLTGSLTD
jgi:hypothetical protein